MSLPETQRPTRRPWRDRLHLQGPALVLVPVAAVVAGLVITTIVVVTRPKKVPAVDVPPVPVEVLTITPLETLADTFDSPAVVEPQRVVNVSAEVAARVERIDVKEGQVVEAGQAMVALNTDLLSAAYRRAAAAAEYDARDLERMVGLRRTEAVSASELDQARAKAEASQATLSEAKAELERAVIVAPLDGVVNRIPVEVGEYVQKGTEVAEIVAIDTVKVVVDVPSRDVAYLKVGSPQRILLNPEGTVVTGQITYVGALADEGTRTTPVEITADNRERTFHSGQIVLVRLKRQDLANVILIPLKDVIPLENGYEVYVVEEGKAQPRIVTLGFYTGTSVRVTSGLKAGDRLIVGGGQRYVAPGQAVSIQEKATTTPSSP
ncbi:MAG: efflux RND transporter periplasmic adaptor subunit [Phycisphaerae bacterium]|nr:efflux RND transporter periplasmic adaptor subunit [Phycisphaerae bacterium]